MIPAELEVRIRRHFHVDRWPIGTIARQLGVHHQTVRRALLSDGVPLTAIASRPKKTDPYVPFMLDILKQYPDLRASRLYDMVCERGYVGARDHFRTVVARYRPRRPSEAYLRLATLPGEQAQVDWGMFGHVMIEGAARPLVAFVMVLSSSRWMFLRFGVDMRMGSFLAHHVAAFEAIEGVPRVILYDNLKSAVTQRIGSAVVFNETLLAFAGCYAYEPRPCAPYRGNEKGRVERGIRDVRESFFAARTWTDLNDLNRQAERWCRETRGKREHADDRTKTVAEAFSEEQPRLRPLPLDRFPTEDHVEVRIAKTPYARFDSNDYSVPHDYVRRSVTVIASPEWVRILDGRQEIARHPRCWGKDRQVERPEHVAALVAYKKKASEGRAISRLYTAVPEARPFIDGLAERGGNIGMAVIQLGELLDAFGARELALAVTEARTAQSPRVATVRQVLDRQRQVRHEPPPLAVALPDDPRVRRVVVRPGALGPYDDLNPTKPQTQENQDG